MESNNNSKKRIFISYSWTNQEHEQRVLDLGTELVDNGIDVVLDKWDLKEGDDADQFMERMVSDPTITKVLIVCDKKYAEKSDKRTGGAGTEAQIISRKVYEQNDENKFVVAAFEINDKTGRPYLPIYYGSRKYIDFTNSSKYAEKFEELVRWIYNKPLYIKPQIGKTPEYILADNKKTLRTSSQYNRVLSLFADLRPNASAALREYLETFAQNLVEFRIFDWNGKQYDDAVIESLDEFLPYRNEWIEVLDCVSKNNPTTQNSDLYHRFFESIHKHTSEKLGVSYPQNCVEENMKFIQQELFLYYIAVLLKFELFKSVYDVLSATYYNDEATSEYYASYSYYDFRHYLYSIEARNERLGLRKYSLHSDIIKDRAENNSIITLKGIQQADFVMYLYYVIHCGNDSRLYQWWPDTLLYCMYQRIPFEIFARAASKKYFERIKIVLGISSKQDILSAIARITEQKVVLPTWGHYSFNINLLANIEKLATKD